MYYHCREVKYVQYGKVKPPPFEVIDEWFVPAYQWLSNYCGYCPQIWLSRSHSSLTGYRRSGWGKAPTQKKNDTVLFGFEHIKGFAVDFEPWSFLLHALLNLDNVKNLKASNLQIMQWLDSCCVHEWEHVSCVEEWKKLRANRDEVAFNAWTKKCLFVDGDQYVVPALNLKAAKKIICHNERQKKRLRKMGFIKDRIEIKNIKSWQ